MSTAEIDQIEHELLDFTDHIDAIVIRTGTLLDVDRLVSLTPTLRLIEFTKIAASAAKIDRAISYSLREAGMIPAIHREAKKFVKTDTKV